jgi:hypothetical protein
VYIGVSFIIGAIAAVSWRWIGTISGWMPAVDRVIDTSAS